VKTVVDATEAALAAQRASLTPPREPSETAADDDEPSAATETPTSPPSGVRRIDLA
jgi:hypothetical protein